MRGPDTTARPVPSIALAAAVGAAVRRAARVAVVLACGLSTTSFAQDVAGPRPPTSPVPNALAEAVRNVGIKRCAPALARLSGLAVQGTRTNDVLLDWDRKRTDASPVFALLGLEYLNAGAALSVTAVPEADGGCSVMAERISVAPFTCQSVAQQELAGYRATRLLPNFTVYTRADDPTSSVSLIDSAPGCLVLRRYVAFSWKEPSTAPR